MAPRRRFGLHNYILIFYSQCQPRKENQAKITGCQVTQAEGAVGEISLGKFFKSDQEGEDQAADNGHPLSALRGKRTEKCQIDEQDKNPVQDEMPCFVPQRNLIENLEDAKLP